MKSRRTSARPSGRRSIRLKGYDYASGGAYFVTICAMNRVCLFGAITDSEMSLSEFGRAAEAAWLAIPKHFEPLRLDAFVIMPNHVHGIIVINGTDRRGAACRAPTPRTFGSAQGGPSPEAGEGITTPDHRLIVVAGIPSVAG